MANNRYFFDKRDWKRRFIKYLICIAVSFVPTMLFNVYVGNKIANWLVILIDCLFILIVFGICNALLDRYFEKKDDERARRRKEREELEKRKKQILEDSYKKKRLEKELKKQEKLENLEGEKQEETSSNKKKTKRK